MADDGLTRRRPQELNPDHCNQALGAQAFGAQSDGAQGLAPHGFAPHFLAPHVAAAHVCAAQAAGAQVEAAQPLAAHPVAAQGLAAHGIGAHALVVEEAACFLWRPPHLAFAALGTAAIAVARPPATMSIDVSFDIFILNSSFLAGAWEDSQAPVRVAGVAAYRSPARGQTAS